jgi:hypothetical protein
VALLELIATGQRSGAHLAPARKREWPQSQEHWQALKPSIKRASGVRHGGAEGAWGRCMSTRQPAGYGRSLTLVRLQEAAASFLEMLCEAIANVADALERVRKPKRGPDGL